MSGVRGAAYEGRGCEWGEVDGRGGTRVQGG